jgi:aspartate-semialdehyde dehydrogenase
MRVAVVGATGLVGREMLKVLEERKIEVSALYPVASQKSIGKSIVFNGRSVNVIGIDQAVSLKPDVALFSAGGTASLNWAPKFAEFGTTVIDNSSAWRMDPNVPLVVPEVNPNAIGTNSKIIANPNCSTIQLVVALSPLHKAFGLERVVISTYQSVTGTGKPGIEQLEREEQGVAVDFPAYPHQIHRNCIPHCDVFLDNGYTKEEMKLVNESRKILGIPDLRVTATAVRVPVVGGHSESVNLTLKKDTSVEEIRTILSQASGVFVQDDPSLDIYPLPASSHGKDNVFVGRIRRDESESNAFNLWVVSDNLRKGAATNAVQILELILAK